MKVFPMLVVLAWVMCFNSFGIRTDTGRAIVWTGNHAVAFGRYVEAIGRPIAHSGRFANIHFPIGNATGLKCRMMTPFLNLSHGTILCLNINATEPNLGKFMRTRAGKTAEYQAEQLLHAINPGESD